MSEKWKVLGESVQGIMHQKTAAPCQDACAYRVLPGGELIVIVADGAGSARCAALGATTAVITALHFLENEIREMEVEPSVDECRELLKKAFEDAGRSVIETALEKHDSPREYASTLTIVLAVKDCVASGQIGDGAVVLEMENRQFWTFLKPKRGEYANETYFLTDDNFLERVEIQSVSRPVLSIIAMTDGLIRLALLSDQDQPREGFFRPLIKFINNSQKETGQKRLRDFLTSGRVCAKTHDDKTLVLAVRQENLQTG